ncbi:nucleoid-associated protein [Roseomonas xinghualingensis]|uniref:nucleoid-associated protein n=1 Tax=Roseomonas xinghualingensis TaxID=2986475 RepID=UPI0021F0F8B1|nr:nucleoid-associated protein [Roseomonas sp. SXEYE001]MCV4207556.1 nucleoid-associated protein [Roseomonas sp. SXEYE001]
MPLENLSISRVCLHEVHRRADDRTIVAPTLSSALLTLDARASGALHSRVVSAFRSDAKCMEMDIARHDAVSVIAFGADLITADDSRFVDVSKAIARLLADAQKSRQYPGGLVVIFDGTVGHPAKKFFAVMKAELHDGFIKQANLRATFTDSLFLSPKTKLYKIGLFVLDSPSQRPLPKGWTATVYDSQLTAGQRDSIALYFHDGFLGLKFPENSAQRTKQFFQKTRDFISSAPVLQEEKVDLYNSLYAYLKTDQSPSIQVGHFADTYMQPAMAQNYRDYMRRERFTDRPIPKDLAEVGGSLRLRRLRFANRITLIGPSEALSENVTVEALPPDGGVERTQIIVRGGLERQE